MPSLPGTLGLLYFLVLIVENQGYTRPRGFRYRNIPKENVEQRSAVLKKHVKELKSTTNKKVELVFLVDSSASVGAPNFHNELKFVRKLLADFTVDINTTRVSVITFSSRRKVIRHIDYLTNPKERNHKCSLLGHDFPKIKYSGGGTFTLGAMREATAVLENARPDAVKAVFLITDGFSNGGDPRPEARALREKGIKIFTFGIRQGNINELYDMASEPKNETRYILKSFEEFESLARRALHEDLQSGFYIPQEEVYCNKLCQAGKDCCNANALCSCGTHTGNYECLCQEGYYGNGIRGQGCLLCPSGTYKSSNIPGGIETCTKCPDINHITRPGATSAEQCRCKMGYLVFADNTCAVQRCAVLDELDHGYFVKGGCDNVFNALCGIHCLAGYEQQGTGIRRCQENGTWSGTKPECIMKTCPPLFSPQNGDMICSRDDFTFKTDCRFTCNTGYTLVNSRKRTCLGIALWSGMKAKCREITCQPLPKIRDGSVSPIACIAGEVAFGTTCHMTCANGYMLTGPHTQQCTPDGVWAPAPNVTNQCLDTSAPFLTCPGNIEKVADIDDHTATITWQPPFAVDNSGYLPTITVEPAVLPPARFPIGSMIVRYTAEDLSRNRGECTFTVTVKDEQPPTIDRCISPAPVVASHLYAPVTWKEPQFSDNSYGELTIKQSHERGLFSRGKTYVTYIAIDKAGNNNTCILEVNVIAHACMVPPAPVNGNLTCKEDPKAIRCVLSCMDGYAFAIQPASVYHCQYDGVWLPEKKMPFPDCSVKKVSNDVVQPASFVFTGELSCRERILINEIELNFEERVTRRVNDLCQTDMQCSVEDMQTTCVEQERQDNNVINTLSNRRKRSTRNMSKEQETKENSNIIFDFMLEGRVPTTGDAVEDDKRQKHLIQSLKNILYTIEKDASEGAFDLTMGDKAMQFANLTFDGKDSKFKCDPGSVLRNASCILCPVGTYFNVISEACESCGLGMYQPVERQVTCLVCPEHTFTETNNTRSLEECTGQCLPGSFSDNGLEVCETCSKGYYQPEYQQTACIPCPDRRTTLKRGARRLKQCKGECPSGYVSKTGLEPCFPCPQGTYQPEPEATSCYRCPVDSLTASIASTRLTDCEGVQWDLQSDYDPQQNLDVDGCFDVDCLNGGTCESRPNEFFICHCTPGYKGFLCNIDKDECKAKPCLNEGICVDKVNDYECTCPAGITGKKCEVNIDDCASIPCKNGATCADVINGYKCSCPNGYTGSDCKQIVDECQINQCRNGGSCVSKVGAYTCNCLPGFLGNLCEIDNDECATSPCQNGATCHDEPNKYRCECEPGFSGMNCETDIDECLSMPCLNGGTCIDKKNTYECKCAPTFLEKNCEKEVDPNFQLDFPAAGITDQSRLTIDRNLYAATICFWMKTADNENYGTPFSYATKDNDNTFTLLDYSGFAFYVNGEERVTDVATNDGLWHHVCVSWASNRGTFKFYNDGILEDSGQNLASGQFIQGGGVFVLGQEQDSLGGGFSPRESFVGTITQMNVWDYELPLSTILDLRISCNAKQGNVIAWPDVAAGIQGSVTSAPLNLCGDCPIPAAPNYGNVEYTGIVSGSQATYTCGRGFNIGGRDRRTCIITGEWEGTEPLCERIACGFPGSIDNGNVIGGRYSYDQRVRYVCRIGFKLMGLKTRYCNEFGIWQGDAPKCLEISCELPELSENTKVLKSQIRYLPNDEVEFYCTPGNKMYTLHNTVLCQGDGTWDKSVPSCDPQQCGAAPAVPDATRTEEALIEYQVGDAVYYQCDPGYRFSPTSPNLSGMLHCLPSGLWDTPLPECELVTCNDPPLVDNSAIDGTERTYLSQVQYICHQGYQLEGEEILECVENGLWEPRSPECRPIVCDRPDYVPNAILKAVSYTFKSSISYICEDGYQMEGRGQRECLADVTWSGRPPKCNPLSCGPPPVIEHGQVVGSNFHFKESVDYNCDEGYSLLGSQDRRCMDTGSWEEPIPSCTRVECGPPPVIYNGYYNGNSFLYKDIIEYRCYQGSKLIGDSNASCASDGLWIPATPGCVVIECPDPKEIPNGVARSTGLTYTSILDYICDAGYEIDREFTRTCLAEGVWSGTEANCSPGTCRVPAEISNGKYDLKDFKLNSVVRYYCDLGYDMLGEELHRCQETLTWSGELPKCSPVQCNQPPESNFGFFSGDSYFFNAIVFYKCLPGYNLEGDEQQRCSENKTWIGSTSCSPVECDIPATVTSNGRMIGLDFTFGSTIHYVCDPGYDLIGFPNRTCKADGNWDNTIPYCNIVTCPRPLITDGFVGGFVLEYGSDLTFSCKLGYVLHGNERRTCQDDGIWSGTKASCIKVECLAPDPINHSLHIVTGTSFGSTTTYFCDEGYLLVGEKERRCQLNETWSGTDPSCTPVVCDKEIGVFANGITKSTGNTYLSVTKYICDIGYQMNGSPTRECKLDGSWSNELPVCEEIVCPEPETISNGEILQDLGLTYLSVIEYDCDIGYKMAGSLKRECGLDGTWSNELPVCEEIVCPEPETISNGEIIQDLGIIYLSVIEYACDIGYKMTGSPKRECGLDGTWSNELPVCDQIVCTEPEVISNGEILQDLGLTYLSVIEYACDIGYKMAGSPKRECGLDGTWSNELPVCEEIVCPEPETISNAEIIQDLGIIYLSVIEYVCDIGYKMAGSPKRECGLDGTWSNELPVCDQIVCTEPEVISNGEIIQDLGIIYLSVIEYACDIGYKMAGSPKRVCGLDGTWSNELPVCEDIVCPEPETISNAEIIQDLGITYLSVIEYTCDIGYNMIGSPKRECDIDGTWSNKLPVCEEIICPEPESISNGEIIQDLGITYLSIIEYACDIGYKMIGSPKRECGIDETWSNELPVCEDIICPEPETISNGEIVQDLGITYLSVIEYACDIGYKMIGSPKRECKINETWSNELPVCEEIICSEPEIISHGTVTKDTGVKYLSVIEYICDIGYEIIGTPKRECGVDGAWSNELPVCEDITCPDPGAIDHGSMAYDTITYKSNATYSCDIGYIMSGPSIRTCLESGAWSDEMPICKTVECPQPDLAPFAKFFGLIQQTYGSVIQYSCVNGYQLEGSSSLTCLESGEWSETAPTCSRIMCPVPDSLPNGRVVGESFSIGRTITHECNEGFKLVGTWTRICLPNRMWTGQHPVCQKIQCMEPDAIENGNFQVTGSNFEFNSTVEYSCNEGFSLVGEAVKYCRSDRMWSVDTPYCSPVDCPLLDDTLEFKFDLLNETSTYQSVIMKSCYVGYIGSGNPYKTCLPDGSWSDDVFTCKIVSCPEIVMPDFGELMNADVNTYGSEVTFLCHIGYSLVGAGQSICLSNGTWSHSPPVCELVKCPMPAPVDNGKVIGTNYIYDSIIDYECDIKYEIVGSPSRTCLDTGSWSEEAPECRLILCNSPPTLTNGQVDNLSFLYIYGDVVSYVCDLGYFHNGENTMECSVGGRWIDEIPSCSKVRCDVPATIENGNYVTTALEYQGIASYDCVLGYYLVGPAERVCQAVGTWSDDSPQCLIVKCPELQTIPNGQLRVYLIVPTKITYGSTAQYACNEGYELHGSFIRSCTETGGWANKEPTCDPVSCDPPEDLLHGELMLNSLTYESILTYVCNPGYTLEGEETRTCTAERMWSGTAPLCTPVPCNPPTPPTFGTIQSDDTYHFESHVFYACDLGYILNGPEMRICQEDGTWTEIDPICKPVECESLDIENGHVSGDSLFGGLVTFSCDYGYELEGSETASCQADASWSDALPTCVQQGCNLPNIDHGGIVSNADVFFVGDSIEFQCDEGYDLLGSWTSQCLPDGTWDNEAMLCLLVSCESPPVIENGYYMGDAFKYEDIAFYRCDNGFEMMGSNLLMCDADKQWQGDLPHCMPVMCELPPVIAFSTMVVSRTTFGSKAYYKCNTGYKLFGNANMECQASKTWEYDKNVGCHPVECGPPPEILQGTSVYQNTSYSSIARYSCNLGFKLDDTEALMCSEDGIWVGEVPVCSVRLCGEPPVYDHAVAIGGQEAGSEVSYACESGYFLATPTDAAVCLTNGTWHAENPIECSPVVCVDVFPPVNGQMIHEAANSYGSIVIFLCDEGFSLDGSSAVICTETGQWNDSVPICDVTMHPELLCDSLESLTPYHIEYLPDLYMIGEAVELQCLSGFHPVGDMRSTCSADKSWTLPQGQCHRIYCGIPHVQDMINIRIIGRSYFFGDRVFYRCRLGLVPIQNPPLLTCTATGDWDGEAKCIANCKFPCLNGGFCVRTNMCKCAQGFAGRFCERPICILPCLHGGTCVSPYRCACRPGYAGIRCQRAICDKTCQNGGYCNRPNRCHCVDGFLPPFCEVKHLGELY